MQYRNIYLLVVANSIGSALWAFSNEWVRPWAATIGLGTHWIFDVAPSLFAGFTLTLLVALRQVRPILALVYGSGLMVLVEVVQLWLPTYTFDPFDVTAGICGAGLAALLLSRYWLDTNSMLGSNKNHREQSLYVSGKRFAIAFACWWLASIGVLSSLTIFGSAVAAFINQEFTLKNCFELGIPAVWLALGVLTKGWVCNTHVHGLWAMLVIVVGLPLVSIYSTLIFFYISLVVFTVYLAFWQYSSKHETLKSA